VGCIDSPGIVVVSTSVTVGPTAVCTDVIVLLYPTDFVMYAVVVSVEGVHGGTGLSGVSLHLEVCVMYEIEVA